MVHIPLSVDAHLWLRRQSETEDITVVYRIMHQNRLLLEHKTIEADAYRESGYCSDGTLADSSSAVIKVKNCGVHSRWIVALAKLCTEHLVSVDKRQFSFS